MIFQQRELGPPASTIQARHYLILMCLHGHGDQRTQFKFFVRDGKHPMHAADDVAQELLVCNGLCVKRFDVCRLEVRRQSFPLPEELPKNTSQGCTITGNRLCANENPPTSRVSRVERPSKRPARRPYAQELDS